MLWSRMLPYATEYALVHLHKKHLERCSNMNVMVTLDKALMKGYTT